MAWLLITLSASASVDVLPNLGLREAGLLAAVLMLISGVMGLACICCEFMKWSRYRAEHNEAKRVEVIVVEESPPPTRRAVTPTSCVRRAGSRRLPSHRRALTCSYNPSLKNHCGFQVVLRAAAQGTGKKDVRRLRQATAAKLAEAYERDEQVHGISIRDLVHCSGGTLEQYLEALKTSLWASEVEMHLAAKVKQVSIWYKDDKKITKIGEGKSSGVAVLRKQHYTLHNAHRRLRSRQMRSDHVKRGGMRQAAWTGWQQEAAVPIPSAEIKVKVVGHEEAHICVTDSDSIEVMRAKIAHLFQVEMLNVVALDPDGDEFPDWVQCPKEITVRIDKPKDNKLPLAYQGARVDLWLQGAKDEAKIKQEVAKLFNVIPALLITKVGNVPWNASMDLDEEEVIEVGILSRGGMQRSVSTTLRWDEGSGSTGLSRV